MSLKKITSHSVLLAAVLYFFLLFRQKMPLTSFAVLCIFWRKRTRDRSWIMVAVLLLFLMIPKAGSQYPDISQGRVISISRTYAVVQNGRTKAVMYTDDLPILDSVISFDADFIPVSENKSFYGFNFYDYCRQKGIGYSFQCSNWKPVNKSHSLRGYLQSRIMSVNDSRLKSMLNLILLGIRSREDGFDSLLKESGISCASFLAFTNLILKYFLCSENRKKVITVLTVFLCILYHFPYLLVQRLIYRILDIFKLTSQQKTGLGMSIGMILFPDIITSASFLVPAVYRLAGCFSRQKRTASLLFGMIVQSYLFHSVNPVEILLWPAIYSGMGFIWLAAFIETLTELYWTVPFELFDKVLSILSFTDISGSLIGFGLIFYLLLCISTVYSKYHLQLWTAFFLVFQLTGLFHPLAEFTLINVGQGDSILIRMPFNTENYLVDTGKPSALNSVETILKAKGINRINTLFITHSDSDHCGNMDYIAGKYQASVADKHAALYQNGRIRFYDLNDIDNDDENQSSLVLFFTLNSMDILLTGDADAVTERNIVRKFGSLQCDILKLSHHGSNTGTSEIFLDCVKPKTALISAGSYSLYHHPHSEVISRLKIRHIPFFNTHTDGDISVFCFPFFNLLLTSGGTISVIT